jgi:hypothetical protein
MSENTKPGCTGTCYLVVGEFDDGERCWNCVEEFEIPSKACSTAKAWEKDSNCRVAIAYRAVELTNAGAQAPSEAT